jgi:hypothetical protein
VGALAHLMNSQALAGDYTGATANLEAIARHHVGADVRILWQPAEHWLGLARQTPSGYEILLNPYAVAGDLGFTFFHECAHLVRGHCENVTQHPPAELAHINPRAVLEWLPPAEQAACGPAIDATEAEADSWAADALAAFEGRFGPFLEAIQ